MLKSVNEMSGDVEKASPIVLETGAQPAAIILNLVASSLPNNGYDDTRRDARVLLAMAMGREDAVLPHEDIDLDKAALARLHDLVERRRKGEPVSRLRGSREFYGLNFIIGPSTLDPRADSEVIVDTVLDYAEKNEALSFVDFGTGSGCLLLASAAHLPKAQGIGVDIQADAVAIAQKNADRLGLSDRITFQCMSWDDGLVGQFDIIISNPPYIPEGDIDDLMDEVRFYDPKKALDGGRDGFDAWRALAPVFKSRLSNKGVAIVEIGIHQTDMVVEIMQQHGLKLCEKRRDLASVTRCLVFTNSL